MAKFECPIKLGFKFWCCSCSCCGYLCSVQVFNCRAKDPVSGKKVSEKGLVLRVVTDLMAPFVGNNHVVYCDNLYTSKPLIDRLVRDKVYVAGTIHQSTSCFPK